MLTPEHISSSCILKMHRKESQAQDNFNSGIFNYWGLDFATFTFQLGLFFFFFVCSMFPTTYFLRQPGRRQGLFSLG